MATQLNYKNLTFDKVLLRKRKNRAALKSRGCQFLYLEVAKRLGDRLNDVNRGFDVALDIGCHNGELSTLNSVKTKIGTLFEMDLSNKTDVPILGRRLIGDEESLPFANRKLDLIISSMSLHWTNDLPGALIQINQALKSDGLLLASFPGGDTLWELRECLLEAEIEITGGASPRISPMIDIHTAGDLMQRAGFALPVIDTDRIVLTYANLFLLLNELRHLGETNTVNNRSSKPPPKNLFDLASRIYHSRFSLSDGRIPATFDILYLTGWVPHKDQQKPLEPGSAKTNLAEFLTSKEKN